MKDHFKEICAWNAGHVITDLYKDLGLDRTYYLDTLAEKISEIGTTIDVDTLVTWRRRERGLPLRYTHKDVMDALDAVMEQYRSEKCILSKEKTPVLAQWAERRETVSVYLKSMIGEDDGPTPAEQFNERMKPRYPTWTLETLCTLYSCFDALNSATWNDLQFWRVLLGTPKELRKDKADTLAQRRVSARRVLNCFYDSEVAQWQCLLNNHETGRTKKKVWAQLLKKMEEHGCDPMIWDQLLDLLIDSTAGTLLGEPRLGQDEIALFILFKYCLTENAQDEVLESWA